MSARHYGSEPRTKPKLSRPTCPRRLTLERFESRCLLAIGDFVINEIHADPESSSLGDANRDGVRSGSQDEFVELVNLGDAINIGGWTLSDATGVVHVFPEETNLASGQAIVVFGGGEPQGSFGGSIVATASTGSLSLNNGGDTLELSDGTESIAEIYGTEANTNQSLTRDPDLSGVFIGHSFVASGLLFSPGFHHDGVTPFAVARAAGLRVDETEGATRVREGSTTDSVTVLLEGTPLQDVHVMVSPLDDQLDVGAGAGESLELVFTTGGIMSQSVTISAVNDDIVQGDRSSGIAVVSASEDSLFDGLNVLAISVEIEEDDQAGVLPGAVVLNEIMQNPSAVVDSQGEFIELWNTTEQAIDLRGWRISDGADGGDSHVITHDAPVWLLGGGYLVLGLNGDTITNGGITVDYVYRGVSLGNGRDTLVLENNQGTVIDQVTWDDGETFPDPNGASMELIPGTSDPATGNDFGSNWQASYQQLTSGDRATPGASNSTRPLPDLSIGDATVSELDGEVAVQLVLSAKSDQAVSVDFTTRDGTALAGQDYVAPQMTRVTFSPGETTASVVISLIDDDVLEGVEDFQVVISNPVGAILTSDTATVQIVDDDVPQATVEDLTVVEGDQIVVTIALSEVPVTEVSVDIMTQDETAQAPDDYMPATRAIVFPPGTRSQSWMLSTVDDNQRETDETFLVRLSNPRGIGIERGEARITIVDNDTVHVAPGSVVFHEIMQNPASVADGVGEYLELWNTTDTPIDIDGWVLRDDDTNERHTINHGGPLEVPAGGYLVLANEADVELNGGIPVGYTYTTISLGNGTDGIVLEAPDGRIIDQVVWDDGATFPDPNGASMELNVGTGNPSVANDEGANWYASTHDLPSGDRGTPGEENSPLGPPEIRVQDIEVAENGGTAQFQITLSRPARSQVTVDVATQDGTAKSPSDYTARSITVGFSPGQTSRTVSIAIRDDRDFDPDETFRLQLTNPVGATLADVSARATIFDNELPQLSIADVSGNERDGALLFTVTLSGPVRSPVSVNVNSADGSATSPSDYAAISTTVLFEPGETLAEIPVRIADDTLAESVETFFMMLSNPVGATVGQLWAVGSIDVSDVPTYHAGDVVFNELMRNPSVVPDESGEFLELWNTTGFPIDLAGWTLRDEEALLERHTIPTTHNLVIPPGEYLTLGLNPDPTSNGGIRLDYVYDFVGLGNDADGLILEDRRGVVIDEVHWDDGEAFPNPNGASIELVPGLASPGVSNDVGANWQVSQRRLTSGDLASPGVANPLQVPVLLTIGNVIVAEGAGEAVFDVDLSTPAAGIVTVEYATVNDTATAPSDYSVRSAGLLTFLPGERHKQIAVLIVDDQQVELNETFVVQLQHADGASIGVGEGTATILNDDAPEILIASMVVDERDGTANMVLALSAPSISPVSVVLHTVSGSATGGSDFTHVSRTETFAPGTLERVVAIPILDDREPELDETFAVQLSRPLGASLGTSEVFVTIAANDPRVLPSAIVINEVDAETVDGNHEFIELFDGGVGGTQLDGLAVVLVDGATRRPYQVEELTGQKTDDGGYFVLGDADVPNVDLIPSGWDRSQPRRPRNNLHDGEDAIVLYYGSVDWLIAAIESSTWDPSQWSLASDSIVDAIVYETGADADTAIPFDFLSFDLGAGGRLPVMDEDQHGNKGRYSNSRFPDGDGLFHAVFATPGESNRVTPPRLEMVQVYDGGQLLSPISLASESVQAIVLTFDRLVEFDGPVASAFEIRNETTGGWVEQLLAEVDVSHAKTIVTLSSFGTESADIPGVLDPGTYRLTVRGESLQANGLRPDGDGDGGSGPGDIEVWFTKLTSARRLRTNLARLNRAG